MVQIATEIAGVSANSLGASRAALSDIAHARGQRFPIGDAIASAGHAFEESELAEAAQLSRDDFADGAQLFGERLLRHAQRDGRRPRRLRTIEQKLGETGVDGLSRAFVQAIDEASD